MALAVALADSLLCSPRFAVSPGLKFPPTEYDTSCGNPSGRPVVPHESTFFRLCGSQNGHYWDNLALRPSEKPLACFRAVVLISRLEIGNALKHATYKQTNKNTQTLHTTQISHHKPANMKTTEIPENTKNDYDMLMYEFVGKL